MRGSTPPRQRPRRYTPTEDGVHFETRYDYRIRLGNRGAIADRLLFRPLTGWATARCFDRLRLRLERGIAPQLATIGALVHMVALAIIFVRMSVLDVPRDVGQASRP